MESLLGNSRRGIADHPPTIRVSLDLRMDLRRKFKIAAIKAQIEFCECERRQIFRMMRRAPVNLAWFLNAWTASRDWRFLYNDLEVEERRGAEEWN